MSKELEKLRGYKRIKINGMRFIIQKINPLVDIPLKELPMIFTHINPSTVKMRKGFENLNYKEQIKFMAPVIKAGVVDPILVDDPNNGFVVDDLFRDPVIGFRLWEEIINHSLKRFRGLKGVFFSIVTKLYLFIKGRNFTQNLLMNILSRRADYQNLKP